MGTNRKESDGRIHHGGDNGNYTGVSSHAFGGGFVDYDREWVWKLNSIQNRVDEIVLHDLIYI